NHPVETLGTISEYIDGISIQGQDIKGNEEFDSLIIMGGPQSVYESENYPYIRKEMDLVRKAYTKGKRVLGICLGSQIASEALGGKVIRGPYGSEIGVQKVRTIGKFSFLGDEIKVFQMHSDTFSLPPGSELLAYSEKYFQAFKKGSVLGIQFHVEVTPEIVDKWVSIYGMNKELVDQVQEVKVDLKKNVGKIMDFWFNMT
ncbi:glutamine amidotransferase, partial [Candidatus Acidianus copahuensis]